MTNRRHWLSLGVLLLLPLSSWGYVEAPQSLGSVIAQSTHIMQLVVTSVDQQNNLIIYRKVEDLKGKHPTDVVKHAIGRGGLRPGEWQEIMNWAAVGKTAIFFHNGGASELFMGPSWYQAYPGGEWWNMSHAEPFLLRTYAGKPEKLAAAVKQILAGQEVVVPGMIDGDKEALHRRRAKIQRLKASLTRQDYNPKRDFVGWGGEDLTRVQGMPGFSYLAELGRVDAESQAVSTVDWNGDGKPEFCLVSSTRVALFKNDGESFVEVPLPGLIGGARAAIWADANGDGKLDLLLATPNGLRLYGNRGDRFVDDSAALPAIPGQTVTAAAWLDADADGKPDLLVGTPFHGLFLLRNEFPDRPQAAPADPKWSDWYTIGPFPSSGPGDIDKVFPPEQGIQLDATTEGKNGKAIAWTKADYPDGAVHSLARYSGNENENAIVYLYREIDVTAPTEIPLSLGSDDGLAVWCNGKRILREETSRAAAADQNRVTLALKPGKNYLLLKVVQGNGDWAFYCQPGMPKSSLGGWFTDVSRAWGLADSGIGANLRPDSISVADFDSDGRTDFLVGGDQWLLARNSGTRFEAVAEPGLGKPSGKFGATLADLDGDGAVDLLIPTGTGLRIVRNRGAGQFEPWNLAGVSDQNFGNVVSVACGDVNNDGLPDLVVGCLRGTNRFLENLGGGRFADRSAAIGLNRRITNARAVALVDVNSDGRLDVVFVNEGQESMLLLGNSELPSPKTPVQIRIPVQFGVIGGRLQVRDATNQMRGSHTIPGGDGRGGQSLAGLRVALEPGEYSFQWRTTQGVQSSIAIRVGNQPQTVSLTETVTRESTDRPTEGAKP